MLTSRFSGGEMFDSELVGRVSSDLTSTRESRSEGALSRGRDGLIIRVLDILIASSALIFLAPMMLMVTFLVWIQDGGAPIYAQRRIGRGGVRFPCFKFRSMVVNADERLRDVLARDPAAREEWARDHKLRNDPRITRLGGFMRKSSIDELPQLVNVLRGEMSIVGPRPIVEAEAVRYGRRFASYCSVRPGLTGLWQVSGRNNTTYRRRVALDHVFATEVGLGLYLWIFLKTIPAVLLRRGSF